MATLADIAEEVGVSKATVSCVLRGVHENVRVSNQVKNQIIKVASDLNYVANLRARAMRTGRSNMIGFITTVYGALQNPNAGATYFTYLAAGQEVCKKYEYHCLFADWETDSSGNFKIPRLICDGSVDGLIIIGYLHKKVMDEISKLGIPFVHIGSNMDFGCNPLSVYADFKTSFRAVCRELVSKGFEDIYYISKLSSGNKKITAEFLDLKHTIEGLKPHFQEINYPLSDSLHIYQSSFELARKFKDCKSTAFVCSERESQGFVAGLSSFGLTSGKDYIMVGIGSDLSDSQKITKKWLDFHSFQYYIGIPIKKISKLATEHLLRMLGVIQEQPQNHSDIEVESNLYSIHEF